MPNDDVRPCEFEPHHYAPLPAPERERLDALIAALPDLSDADVHRDLLGELRSIVRADGGSSTCPHWVEGDGWVTDYAYFRCPGHDDEALAAGVHDYLRGVGQDDLSPVMPLREACANRAVYCSPERIERWARARALPAERLHATPVPRLGIGVVERRTLLGMLEFTNSGGDLAPWGATALERLRPVLSTRFAVDARLREARVLTQALDSALELLDVPAMVLVDGRIAHLNALAKRWRDRDAEGLKSALERSLMGLEDAPLAVDRRRLAGMSEVVIAVQRRPRSKSLLSRFAVRHELTTREEEVLSQLASGFPNKVIAANLGCSVKTVEFFISALLRKARCESRTELVGRLLLIGDE